MNDWKITRTWKTGNDKSEATITTPDLISKPAGILLGAAGLGKTFEFKQLQECFEQQGLKVVRKRFMEVAPSLKAESLEKGLLRLSKNSQPGTVIMLDATDEAMIPIRMIFSMIKEWVETLGGADTRLFIACRSAVWDSSLTDCMKNRFGNKTTVAYLQPLSTEQQEMAALAENLEGTKQFFKSIQDKRLQVLASQPLTLKLLIKEFLRSDSLPDTRHELFSRGINALVNERQERQRSGGVPEFSTAEIIKAAELLACFLLLSDKEAISLCDNDVQGCLHWNELENLELGEIEFSYKLLETISATGLCESYGTEAFQFSHRLYAEFLAGRLISKLPFHQARTLLASPAGWESGVAGPLRETSAIAASHSNKIARWIAETDPDVIGLSEVADDSVRRQATLSLLKQFENMRVTDAQLRRGGLQFHGLKNQNAELDLKPYLDCTTCSSADATKCAIEMVKTWQLTGLYEDLVSIVLDDSADQDVRLDAGYALIQLKPGDECLRLKPLLNANDADDELKGIALRCLWPKHINDLELLGYLTVPQRDNFYGAYSHFLSELSRSQFEASKCKIDGLIWAKTQFERTDDQLDPLYDIAQCILHSALDDLEDPLVLEQILDIVSNTAKSHNESPFRARRDRSYLSGQSDTSIPPFEIIPADKRREFLLEIAKKIEDEIELSWIIANSPSILLENDFDWLLDEAISDQNGISRCNCAARLIQCLPWTENSRNVARWLKHREKPAIRNYLNYPLSVDLDSDYAKKEREYERILKGDRKRKTPEPLNPPPADRVEHALSNAENENPNHFRNLCVELSLKPDSTHYGAERYLSQMAGWKEASETTRSRIIEAAKRYLTSDENDDAEQSFQWSLKSIYRSAMPAILLVAEFSPEWLQSQPNDWWEKWSWLILREIHLNLMGEPKDIKKDLFRQLYSRAASSVRNHLCKLSTGGFDSEDEQAHILLKELLTLLDNVSDTELDTSFCDLLKQGKVSRHSIRLVAEFVLSRSSKIAKPIIIDLLKNGHNEQADSTNVLLLATFLHSNFDDAWPIAMAYFDRNPNTIAECLMLFTSGRIRIQPPTRVCKPFTSTASPIAVGELVQLLFEHFPPKEFPENRNAFRASPDDSAHSHRDNLLNWLSDTKVDESDVSCNKKSEEKILALKDIEDKFGGKYSWLRRSRSAAERNYRLTHRKAIPLEAIAELLSSENNLLIRHDTDVVDGIEAALHDLEWQAHHQTPPTLKRYWNTPSDNSPSPKEEEFVSDEISLAIGRYFQEFAVVADREVQLIRRSVPEDAGGLQGSLVDIFVTAPARGTVSNGKIVVPIEVKKSCNRDVKKAMKTQLADRYMDQCGSTVGIYVVAWFQSKNLKPGHAPKWKTIEKAREDLEQQAKQLHDDKGIDIKPIVLDFTLK